MRNIISQIIALWDICRKEQKTNNIILENTSESNLTERTWRPWVGSDFYHINNYYFLSIRNIFMHWVKYLNHHLLHRTIPLENMSFDFSFWFVRWTKIWSYYFNYLIRVLGVRLLLMIQFHLIQKIDVFYHKHHYHMNFGQCFYPKLY